MLLRVAARNRTTVQQPQFISHRRFDDAQRKASGGDNSGKIH